MRWKATFDSYLNSNPRLISLILDNLDRFCLRYTRFESPKMSVEIESEQILLKLGMVLWYELLSFQETDQLRETKVKIDEGNENNNSNNDAESGKKGTIVKVLLALVGLLVGALIGNRLSVLNVRIFTTTFEPVINLKKCTFLQWRIQHLKRQSY